jgi:hypothetical protein
VIWSAAIPAGSGVVTRQETILQWFAAVLLACGCVNLAEFADFPPAKGYIAQTDCSKSDDPLRCRSTRDAWLLTYASAVGGVADSQRTVALCFSTGCSMAIVPQPVLGCAWRHVVARSAHSGYAHAQSTAGDTAAIETFCGAGALDNADRQTARDQSAVWLQLLGVTQ